MLKCVCMCFVCARALYNTRLGSVRLLVSAMPGGLLRAERDGVFGALGNRALHTRRAERK